MKLFVGSDENSSLNVAVRLYGVVIVAPSAGSESSSSACAATSGIEIRNRRIAATEARLITRVT
jgi:hypothetical protein